MKKLIVTFAALATLTVASMATSTPALAYPGAMCFSSDTCARCEVCVKASQFAPTGTCMAIAGCY
jgi:hypothetical protein